MLWRHADVINNVTRYENSHMTCRDVSHIIRELKNHDEVHDDDVCWLGKDWNENVGFGGKKES